MDFGSFSLCNAEGPIFVDRGRGSYNSDKEGIYGFSAESHNTTLINGLPLVPNCRGGWFAYRKCLNIDQKVSSRERSDERQITWGTRSVERFGKSLKWNRDITLRLNHFEIIETLYNPMHINVEIKTYFHLASGWEVDFDQHDNILFLRKAAQKYRFMFERSSGPFTIELYNGRAGEIGGWHFPDYGTKVPAITLGLSFQSAESYRARFFLCQI